MTNFTFKGKHHTEEARQKISEGNKGKKLSEETKQKISEAKKGNKNPMYGKSGNKSPTFGRKHTDEERKKIGDKLKGQFIGDKNPFYGKKHSEEVKNKIRNSRIGVKSSDETKKKLSDMRKGEKNSFYGKKHSEETIIKLREINKGKIISKETRKKISDAIKGSKHGRWIKDREKFMKMGKVRQFMCNSLWRILRNKNNYVRYEEILGYSKENLIKRLEDQFEDDMNWENYGKFGWHIDHIKPINAFISKGIIDPKIINAIENLQPLWWNENLTKYTKIVGGA